MNTARMLLVLGAVTLLALTAGTRAQGPDEKGAVLVGGFGDSPRPAPAPTNPAPSSQYVPPSRSPADRPDFNKFFPGLETFDGSQVPVKTTADLEEKPDINRDIQIQPNIGPWTIFLIGCTGEDGPVQARKMVTEMRGNPAYRLPAYVFYYGAEERRKENERVKKLIAEQMDFFQKNKIVPDEALKVKHRSIEVQYAVLLGGYPDAGAAKSALERMRHLPAPDPKKVHLDGRYWETPGTKQSYAEYINPFLHAFVCRNPSVKDQAGQMTKEEALKELAQLRGLNADEPYSLFNCKKPITLVVKGYQTPTLMKGQETTSNSFLASITGSSQKTDFAKKQGHFLAEWLREQKIEAYVLHTTYSSIVTVGGYDSLQDPGLKYMQEQLARKMNDGAIAQHIGFFKEPVPMPVPR